MNDQKKFLVTSVDVATVKEACDQGLGHALSHATDLDDAEVFLARFEPRYVIVVQRFSAPYYWGRDTKLHMFFDSHMVYGYVQAQSEFQKAVELYAKEIGIGYVKVGLEFFEQHVGNLLRIIRHALAEPV